MQTLFWDAINPATGLPFTFDDPNLFWGDPSYYLEPGDPGYVPYPSSNAQPTLKPSDRCLADNPQRTERAADDLLACGTVKQWSRGQEWSSGMLSHMQPS